MADEFLESVLKNVEELGGGLAITLNVNGALISGRLVTEEEYIKGLALDFDKHRSEGTEEPTEPSERAIDVYRGLFGWKPRETGDPIRYIHLSEPTIHQRGANIGVVGDWWRGRVEAVDGFQFGKPKTDSK